jgi:hypothetical protein
MSRIPEGVAENVKAGVMAAFEPFTAVAKSCMEVPTCMEKLVLGVNVILAGKGEGPGGLLLPHAGRNKNKEMATTAHAH